MFLPGPVMSDATLGAYFNGVGMLNGIVSPVST